jgi:hypothetical protein
LAWQWMHQGGWAQAVQVVLQLQVISHVAGSWPNTQPEAVRRMPCWSAQLAGQRHRIGTRTPSRDWHPTTLARNLRPLQHHRP